MEPSEARNGLLANMTGYGVKETTPEARRTRVPHVVPGCDLRKLPLSTLEAYVFSRVDGTMAEDELIVCTGLDALVVAEALDRLASFGALSFSEAAPRRTISQTHTRAPISAPGAPSRAPMSRTRGSSATPASPMPSAPSRAPASYRGRPSSAAPAAPAESHHRSHAVSGAPSAPKTAPPGRSPSGARSHLVTRPPTTTTSRPEAPARMTTAAPPRGSVSPSNEPRALTPVPTTYRPGSMRPEYGDTLRRYLEGARTAIAEGNAAAAANYYRLAQQIAPTDPAINSALAECSSVSAEARASSDRAVTLMLLGDNAARAKQWGVAASAYEEACTLVPKDPAILYKLAGALYRCGGQLGRANQLAEESIALSRNRVEAWLLLAQIRWESGGRVAAREAAQEAKKLRPDDERVVKLLMKFGSVR